MSPRVRFPAALRAAVLVGAATLAAACGGSERTISDLDQLQDLKVRFNADAGKPRVVLLLSPT